ncbi:terpene cyclase/mutase family protein [Streptomyces triculaminicus]|uniref:Terpene cyclase/mutase family protein n=2 Tax=Streptomyces TaxID=1883 RepID=A0A939FTZ3_9ACTN|nr:MULTISPECIES: prenyltransferase/squalene oxidase repeat-containing protein [Streptomyces]MBO0656779.1 terpene cyclase/mutase family protein [Streptomyces triculaminicus]QSY47784.1 terpene cyclase/mutase family protein [Streptomyces griseocarneus]
MAPSFAVHARRAAATLAAAAVLGTAAAPAAVADGSPSPAVPGLFGSGDPKFDGVFRQSLALLAQDATGVDPAPRAVAWLAGQQCADGGFAAFRADTGTACDAKAGEFTDATGAAVQALAAVGGGHRDKEVDKGLGWLKAHQNEDGGWGMTPGSPSDANSTSTAVGAFAAARQDPAKVTAKGGKSPYDALLTLQAGCDKKEDERGGFAPNDLASAAAALGVLGKGYLVAPAAKDDAKPVKALECADDESARPKDAPASAEAVAAHLARKLEANGGFLKSSMPGAPEGPDTATTADAALALAAGGHTEAAGKTVKWLQADKSGTAAWAKGNPGRLAKIILAVHAAGGDPRSFAGTDFVQALNETGPTPESSESPQKKDEKKDKKKDGDNSFGVWWFVGVFFVASVGVGFLLSNRKKNQL